MKKKLLKIKSIGKKMILRKIPIYAFFIVSLFVIPYPNPYLKKFDIVAERPTQEIAVIPSPPLYPVLKGDPPPQLSADGILVKDISSGAIIYSKSPSVRFPPASTTKIMTAIIGMEYFKPDDILTVRTVISEGRVMGLVSGETMTFENLLYGALVHSANDAAYAIAENYPGGVSGFVKRMNEKAKEMMLDDTRFDNPIGFDNDAQYTTALDLARQAIYGLSDKTFSKIVSTKAITVSDANYTIFHNLTNVNELLGKIPGLSGVKTGLTANAGEVLVSEVRKNGHEIIIVVLKSRDRFSDTAKLIEWVFKDHEWVDISRITGQTQEK